MVEDVVVGFEDAVREPIVAHELPDVLALEERCRIRQAERAGRHEQTIGERLVADQAVLRPLPEAPFEPCDKRPAKVSSTALVRYRMNDYSVPTAYGFRDVLVKGFVDQVAIICGADEIARHFRIYGRGQFVFDPKHYLALLEQKPGALDQAAPLQSWTLPEPLQHLRRLLEVRMSNRGKREFIQVLRLMEIFPESIVVAATTDAIRLGALSFDAVKQLVITKVEAHPPACSPSRRLEAGSKPDLRVRAGHMANTRAGVWIVRSRFRLERGGNGFIDSFEPNKFELFARLGGNILEVFPVPRRKHDALDAGPVSRNDLFFDSAHREHGVSYEQTLPRKSVRPEFCPKSLNPKSKGNRPQNHRSRANIAFGRAAFVA
jgi:hypothetical protein